MLGIPLVVARYSRDLYGVVSVAELDSLGVSADQRRRLVQAGHLLVLFEGVYRLASAPDTFLARCRAICLACRAAVITGRAAGKLWGVRRVGPEPRRIEVRVPHFAQSFGRDVIQRRCNVLDPEDVVNRPDGIRVISAARLPFDLAAVLSRIDLESVIEQILDLEWCTVDALWATDQRMYHPARPGSAAYRRVLASRPGNDSPADSHPEVVLYEALLSRGVQGLRRQFELVLANGDKIHPDLAVPDRRWAIEVDHVTWHGGRLEIQRDKRRDRQASIVGWTTSRVTDDDIAYALAFTVEELFAVYRRLAPDAA